MGKIPCIQYLRAFAALSVLTYHLPLGSSFTIGAAGVDVFFVISGFIMWATTEGRQTSPTTFLVHRAIRIIPLYWLATLGLVGGAIVIPWLLPNLRPTGSHVLMSLFFIPHLAPDGTTFPVLVPGWTLSYEVLFYILFAAGLLLPVERRQFAVTAALVTLVVAGLILSPRSPLAIVCTSPLLLEFAAGMWLARMWARKTLPPGSAGYAMLGAGIIWFAVLQIGHISLEAWRPVLWGIPAFLIVGGALVVEVAGRFRAWAPLLLLGNASYSMYLLQGPVLRGVLKATKTLSLPLVLAIILICVGAVSIGSYYLVETKLTTGLRRLWDRHVARRLAIQRAVANHGTKLPTTFARD